MIPPDGITRKSSYRWLDAAQRRQTRKKIRPIG